MLYFEREAGSKALRKLYLVVKQLYKMCKLDLLSKGKGLNEENFAKARIIFWSQKISSSTFFTSVISFESYL